VSADRGQFRYLKSGGDGTQKVEWMVNMGRIIRNEKHFLRNRYNIADGEKSENIVIILDDVEFGWKKKDIENVIKMWRAGVSFSRICKQLERHDDEVFLLLLHLARNNSIKKRDGFVWGSI
jgi:hypothetical protein